VPIHTEVSGPIARITIENPPMNQIDPETHTAFMDALVTLAARSDIRVLVLTGAGDRAFCAGADIKGLAAAQRSPAEVEKYAAAWDELYRRIRVFPHPTVAAVNGYALGGGFEILLSTDIRIVAGHAKMGSTAGNLGLITSIHSLATQLPLPLAKELFFTARHVTAVEALQMGLVNRVVPLAELGAAVDAMVEQILCRAPLAVVKAKELMHMALVTDRDEHDLVHRQNFVALAQTEDHREGLRAFVERRRPQFSGR
jgi:enoyl-CoA hydratase/carnithine racemase